MALTKLSLGWITALGLGLGMASISTIAADGSTRGTLRDGGTYEKKMEQAGMSGMSGMSGDHSSTAAPVAKEKQPAKKKDKPAAKQDAAKSDAAKSEATNK